MRAGRIRAGPPAALMVPEFYAAGVGKIRRLSCAAAIAALWLRILPASMWDSGASGSIKLHSDQNWRGRIARPHPALSHMGWGSSGGPSVGQYKFEINGRPNGQLLRHRVWLDFSGGRIDFKLHHTIRLLIASQQPAAGWINRQSARGFSTAGNILDQMQVSCRRVDGEHADAVVTAHGDI